MSGRDPFIDGLADQLRALRLPDEESVILSFGTVRERQCGDRGAISVTVRKHDTEVMVEALHLEDALLMARFHVDAKIDAAKKERKTKKAAS